MGVIYIINGIDTDHCLLVAFGETLYKNIMDLTHLHLMITHLPVYGSILGALILIYGMVAQSRHTKMAAYYVLLISSLGGVIAFSTGEAAEETVERMQG